MEECSKVESQHETTFPSDDQMISGMFFRKHFISIWLLLSLTVTHCARNHTEAFIPGVTPSISLELQRGQIPFFVYKACPPWMTADLLWIEV